MTPPRDCPCGTGLRYAACCGQYHEGALAPTPEALMRSRFAAFALGLGDYLVDTLAAEHPDHAEPRPALARALAAAHTTQRFQRLTVLHASADGDRGEVLFFAGIFGKGATPARRRDLSFAELSRFVREDGAWKYAAGDLLPAAALPADPASLDRDAFLRLLSETR